ncbi:MAG: hypothetical protein ACE5HV_17490 [Acidobacteriota bacterium]
MLRHLSLPGAAGVVAALVLAGGPAAADVSDYKVRDLLEPCVEGDNDSRGGAVLEMECEQYVSGFTDLYIRAGLDKKDGVCLPPAGNRADEVRWLTSTSTSGICPPSTASLPPSRRASSASDRLVWGRGRSLYARVAVVR